MKFPIPDGALKSPVAIVGTVGSGKSYTGKGIVERLLRAGDRVCIIDPTGAWWGLKSSADGKSPGFGVVIFGGDHADVPIDDRMGDALGRLVATTSLQCVLDLAGMTMGGRTRFVKAFLETAYHLNKATLYLIMDEADLFAPQRPLPDQMVMLNRCEQIVRRGRIKGFRVTMITQRPAELHKSVLSQAGTLVAMKLTAPQDRKAIGAWIEGQADAKEGAAVLAALPRMKTGEGYVWSPALGILEHASFPRITTFDSSRTPEPGDEIVTPTKAADVDLSAIRAQLESEVEEAAANDPAALKKRIKELETKLAAPAAATRRDINAELQAAHADGVKQGHADGYQAGWRSAVYAGREALSALPLPAPSSPGLTHRQTAFVPERPISSNSSQSKPILANPSKVADGISRPQQRILDALAWLESVRIDRGDRTRVAMLADQSPKSSGFEKNVSTLSTKGLIRYPVPGELQLTEAGRNAANTPGLKPTSAELQGSIASKISRPQWALLEVLIKVYPAPLTREDLAAAAGVSATSSGFEKNVSTLSGFGFVEYPVRGSVAASRILFVEH